ncbi:hypothetical protein, partial [Lacrimispora sp.]|uniref:hypothetical protein n=1 Tax=Lacrimispora sp. TaxID=2719234 RepID=UPI0032E4B0FA
LLVLKRLLTQVNSNDKTLNFQGKIPFDIEKRRSLCAAPLFAWVWEDNAFVCHLSSNNSCGITGKIYRYIDI